MAIQQQIEEKDLFQEKFFFSLLKFENIYFIQDDDDFMIFHWAEISIQQGAGQYSSIAIRMYDCE